MKLFSYIAIVIAATVAVMSDAAFGAAGDHFDAEHCEIFVDKVKLTHSSHGTHGITFYIKTLPGRLDGAIAEVGLHQQVTTTSRGQDPVTTDWYSEKAASYFGASDYFEIFVYLGSTYQDRRAEGVFYVRTANNTTYWLKPDANSNYEFDYPMYKGIRDLHGPVYPSYSMIPTQAQDVLRPLNPSRCF